MEPGAGFNRLTDALCCFYSFLSALRDDRSLVKIACKIPNACAVDPKKKKLPVSILLETGDQVGWLT